MYNVKLSNSAIEELRNMFGVTDGKVNLKTGIIQVSGQEDLKKIADKFEIDNVNHQPYAEIIPDAAKESTTLEERNRIIGYNLEVGSVVRVKGDKGAEHAVIIAVNGNNYTAAKLALSNVTPETYKGPENIVLVPLVKGKDIIYRNLTYKDHVTLVGEVHFNLQWKDFLKGAGGMIVGKVTNLDAIQEVIELANEAVKNAQAENGAEEPKAEAEAEASPEDEGNSGINFLKAIEDSETLDELFSKLGVASEILKQAAAECMETGRSNLKKLIPVLQEKYEKLYGRLSQSAIKNKMNDEIKEWCESHNVEMEECSISYFLKAIVKGLKKS